jgi:putative ABC transport system ATP-binding protein
MAKSIALLAALQKVPLFSDLSPSQLQRLFGICQKKSCTKHAALCRAGADSEEMFVLLSGSVVIRSESDTPLMSQSAITTIGESGMLTGEPRSATVVAESDLSVLAIDRRAFLQLMQEDPTLATRFYRNVMTILRQKLIASNRRIDQLLQNQA